jgi:hypothetical protein
MLPIVCQPAAIGLIRGTMDWQYPILYVNAISFRGLRQAALLASLLDRNEEAGRWRELAAQIRSAWLRALVNEPGEAANERTFMSALWPTWIAGTDCEPFRRALAERWETLHGRGAYPERPLWTYFTIGEAHQWLFLGQPDKVWQTLRYFWNNQCSPGLYTYWEGRGEENAFPLWAGIRGWVKPPHVTPHYWTAAEMLLLQVDMLAYVDESGPTPTLVIGAGVPSEWLRHPLRVRGLPTSAGLVSWEYGDHCVRVALANPRNVPVRLGASFAENGVALRITDL